MFVKILVQIRNEFVNITPFRQILINYVLIAEYITGYHLQLPGFSANEKALNKMFDIARKGIPMVMVGVYLGMVHVNIANVQDCEYSLIGTLMYVHEDYLESIDLVKQGKIDLKTLITNKYPLEKMQDAYKHIEQNKDTVQKVVIEV
jgi:L-iditol 2-dehydrogenase